MEKPDDVEPRLILSDYLASYESPSGTGITLEDATAAVRRARDTT
ncbi:hypothetical protein [Lentzea alba]|nr:hypothetical protein [Lentzea alba]